MTIHHKIFFVHETPTTEGGPRLDCAFHRTEHLYTWQKIGRKSNQRWALTQRIKLVYDIPTSHFHILRN